MLTSDIADAQFSQQLMASPPTAAEQFSHQLINRSHRHLLLLNNLSHRFIGGECYL